MAISKRLGGARALKTLPAGRKARIITYANKQGQVTVVELAEYLKVSPDTIRRDLDELSSDDLLIRTHGGAISMRLIPKPDSNLDLRLGIQTERKEKIARATVTLIENNCVLLMNSGTTILAVARALANHKDLTIVTNNLQIAKEISPSSVRALHIVGGTVLFSSEATIGPVALPIVGGEEIHIQCDIALISVGGVSAQGGYSVSNLAEASMFKEMIYKASKVVILADATKINLKLFAKLANLSDADYFVTDEEPPAAFKAALHEANVKLVLPA
jgi:DeoR/GlpR family transcriptional regulator of sugar metabolism